ncbi:hypothetical protein [Bosea sp. PAMC 26642]|uniref:hypothetical protein n=1 Tax=Bosea sp. (strain PAMC 26642) TaxID=1792307 RepID=UPI0007706076|nr:hypothetical protein [Bosea sp. PAMC 26642]AMJ58922.1 hypothetical protein AXW83_00155 [Bosea sp. PAMC 26642]
MMRVMLDEGVPRHLAQALTTFSLHASAFPNTWKGIRNGLLLARVQAEGYDVLLTNDKSIGRQQNMLGRMIAVVAVPTNWRPLLMPRAADIAATIRLAKPGDHISIALNGSRRIDNRPVGGTTLPPIAPFQVWAP